MESHPLSVILFGEKGYYKLMTEKDYMNMIENVKVQDSTKLSFTIKPSKPSNEPKFMTLSTTINGEINSESEDPLLVSNLPVHEEQNPPPSKNNEIVHEENETVISNNPLVLTSRKPSKKKKKMKKNKDCSQCGKLFGRNSDLRRHVEGVHEKSTAVKCTICQKIYTSPDHLKVHVRSVHEKVKLHHCTFCDKSFKQKNLFQVIF